MKDRNKNQNKGSAEDMGEKSQEGVIEFDSGENGELYLIWNEERYKVEKAWESFTGWYWFGVERAYTQDSVIEGKVYENDQIWFGFIQGHCEEWGYFSEAELKTLIKKMKVWEIPKKNLSYSGRRA